VTPSPAPASPPASWLREIRRGDGPDEIFLIQTDGSVVILHGHGVHADEAARTREAALKLLGEALGQ